jgi:hypothetical protein
MVNGEQARGEHVEGKKKPTAKQYLFVLLALVGALAAGVEVSFLFPPSRSGRRAHDCSGHSIVGKDIGAIVEGMGKPDAGPRADTAEAPPAANPAGGVATQSPSRRDTSAVAVVNNVAIRAWVLDNALRDRLFAGDTAAANRDSLLQGLITFELLYQHARQNRMVLSEGAGVLRSEAVKRAYGDEQAFRKQLEKSGLTEAEYREQWYRQATVNMFIEEKIKQDIRVSESALEKLHARIVSEGKGQKAASLEESRELLTKMYVDERVRMEVDKLVAKLREKAEIRIAK